jgi:hypothetical protein
MNIETVLFSEMHIAVSQTTFVYFTEDSRRFSYRYKNILIDIFRVT